MCASHFLLYKLYNFPTKQEASVSEDLLCDQSCLNSLCNNGFKLTLYVLRTKMSVSIFLIFQKVEIAELIGGILHRTDGETKISSNSATSFHIKFFI